MTTSPRTLAAFSAMLLAMVLAHPGKVQAQPAPMPDTDYDVDMTVDGLITGGATAALLLVRWIPVRDGPLWERQIFGAIDDRVKDNFSDSASWLSDLTLISSLAIPLVVTLPDGFSGGFDGDNARRTLLYGESLAINGLLSTITKYVVQRPRPYTYHPDPRVKKFASEAGKDTRLSFYSGHASTAFAAAVAGSYLFAANSDDRDARAVMWFTEVMLATATANLRVRAGRHFYSDIVLGAIVGSAIGFIVPALHEDEAGVLRPSGREWAGIAGGIILGASLSQLWPIDDDIRVPLSQSEQGLAKLVQRLIPTPMVFDGGAGIALTGRY